MAIYKIEENNEKLVKVDTTSLGEEDIWERRLQRMLRDQPEVLEEGLRIISEEFSNWQDAHRRIDLLGLDATGRLVVIELKRGYTGEHMDLQAIRYAAMVANMTYEQAVDTYQAYLNERANPESGDQPDDADNLLQEHLPSNDQDEPVIHTEIPRIILASEDFGKELTTCVMWLNDSWLRDAGHEIKCVRLQPHRNVNEILIEASVVIPLPDASDYQTQLGKREQETKPEGSGKVQFLQGADAFQASIELASEKFQEGVRRLYETAKTLEDEKIAVLFTRINGKGEIYTIDLTVPGSGQKLVSFANFISLKGRERGGHISFWPREDGLAPNSFLRIDALIGPVTSKSGWRHRMLSGIGELEPVLSAIKDAYREANSHQFEAASADQ